MNRNTLAKDIEKQIESIKAIITKHNVELNAEYRQPLLKAMDCLRSAQTDNALVYLNQAREHLGEARIEAIIDEVCGRNL